MAKSKVESFVSLRTTPYTATLHTVTLRLTKAQCMVLASALSKVPSHLANDISEFIQKTILEK